MTLIIGSDERPRPRIQAGHQDYRAQIWFKVGMRHLVLGRSEATELRDKLTVALELEGVEENAEIIREADKWDRRIRSGEVDDGVDSGRKRGIGSDGEGSGLVGSGGDGGGEATELVG